MKFTITTEKGSKMELDTDIINGVEVEIGGETYDISIIKK